jgi:antitoxin (DNA-binding transcriptional repressor) of toxin-antitoxin stability system
MKTMTVTEVSRNFRHVMDGVEQKGVEVLLVRNRKAIARLIPEPSSQTALEVLGDLYRTLDTDTGETLEASVRAARKKPGGTLAELRNPWAS